MTSAQNKVHKVFCKKCSSQTEKVVLAKQMAIQLTRNRIVYWWVCGWKKYNLGTAFVATNEAQPFRAG
jgi:hypothetical protein